MRVADNQVYNSIIYSMKKNMDEYYRMNEKIASGKEINRPSDDPSGTGLVMRFREQIDSLEQYGKNIQHAKAFLSQVDISLGSVTDLLISAKETALLAANSTRSSDNLAIMADKVSALKDQVIQQANARMDDQYIFAGFDMGSQPYDSSGTYQGDSGEISVRINKSSTLKLNFPGDQVFGTAGGGVDVFQTLSDLETALKTNDMDGIHKSIGNLDQAMAQINVVRSKSGYRINQLDNSSDALDQRIFENKEQISTAEDLDVSKAYMKFQKQEFLLKSVMASSAKLLQTNLLNFLQ